MSAMAPDPTPPGLLSGVRVIEYGRNITAPFAGKILADLGADVIKVEPPEGEPARALGPFQDDAPNPEAAAQFIYLNGNKRGVTLDLDRPSGRALLDGLLRGADIFLENAEPGEMEARGLTYSLLAPRSPAAHRHLGTPLRTHRPLPQPARLRPHHLARLRPRTSVPRRARPRAAAERRLVRQLLRRGQRRRRDAARPARPRIDGAGNAGRHLRRRRARGGHPGLRAGGPLP